MIKVCIIDDHQLILEGLQSLLSGEGNISLTGLFKNSGDMLFYFERNIPDVVLMDINLPEISGLELCRMVIKKYPGVKVIGLSTSNEISVIKNMMANGASGYLLKDAGRSEIIEAITNVYQGKVYINRSVSEVLKKASLAPQVPMLTRREKDILELISNGMTNSEIAARLFVTVNTVDSHRKNMLTKFDVKNTAALVKLAMHNKLI